MSNLPAQRTWGKIFGFLLGLLIGSLWGAVIGLVVGHMHDRQKGDDARARQRPGGGKEDVFASSEQSIFTQGVIVLSAKMAKSDGRVTRAEIDAFKRVFRIPPAQEDAVGRLFNRARLSADGFEPYALQLAHVFRRNSPVLEEILSGLFIIGAADYSGLSPAEITFLKRVAYLFGFDGDDFARIAARSGVSLPRSEKSPAPATAAFAILGLAETATAAEAKLAYRALIRKHHPDKLMAQGMPAEFVATATEKMKRINVAYDTVCKIRGVK